MASSSASAKITIDFFMVVMTVLLCSRARAPRSCRWRREIRPALTTINHRSFEWTVDQTRTFSARGANLKKGGQVNRGSEGRWHPLLSDSLMKGEPGPEPTAH